MKSAVILDDLESGMGLDGFDYPYIVSVAVEGLFYRSPT